MCCLAKRQARFHRCALTIYGSIRSAGFGPNRRRSTGFVATPGCPSHAGVVPAVRSISAVVAVKRSLSPVVPAIRVPLVGSQPSSNSFFLLLKSVTRIYHFYHIV